MKRKFPEVAIIGAGNLARVLALCLWRAGFPITEIIGRDTPASRRRAAALARRVGAQPATLPQAQLEARVLWICVSDDAIAGVARQMARRRRQWKGQLVVHTSGALAAGVLAPLARRRAAVASAHPMNTFVPATRPDLTGTPFAIEGDAAALRRVRSMIAAINGGAAIWTVRPEAKVLYHAFGSFSSPLLIALLAAGEHVAQLAGMRHPQAYRRQILAATLANYAEHGAAGAFSGPIRRGDLRTIRGHLRALRADKKLGAIYRALAAYAAERLPVARHP